MTWHTPFYDIYNLAIGGGDTSTARQTITAAPLTCAAPTGRLPGPRGGAGTGERGAGSEAETL